MKNNIPLSVLYLLLLFFWQILNAEENINLLVNPNHIKTLFKEGTIKKTDIPNPHWNEKRCHGCHKGKPQKNKLRLENKDTDSLCNNCHVIMTNHITAHPVDSDVPEKMLERMPEQFLTKLNQVRLKGKQLNKLGCISCHDVVKQCYKSGFVDKDINPMFIREGPYRSRSGFCYQCHNKQAYQRLNAHDQITDTGQWLNDKCLLCHEKVPQQDSDGNRDIELKVKDNFIDICLNCHQWNPHPGGNMPFKGGGGPMHLVVPSRQINEQRKKMMDLHQVNLPLENNTGKVYCATCHNPHERGIIKDVRNAKGADEPKRLRTKNICENCHDL
ncbi:MAG: hypothetical protein OEY89_14540 [Gammaproteobacteria bacterium]|nr:hypothetical protein [Gammaproteobacteria bacterium]